MFLAISNRETGFVKSATTSIGGEEKSVRRVYHVRDSFLCYSGSISYQTFVPISDSSF